MPTQIGFLIYAQQGREILKTYYSDGSVTFTDIGADSTNSPDGTVLGLGGTVPGVTDAGSLAAQQPPSTGDVATTPAFGLGGAPFVQGSVGLIGDTNPVDLSPLWHSPAFWFVGGLLGVLFWVGRDKSGRARGGYGYGY